MILTWLGIVVTVAVLVAWVLYENRRLIAACRGLSQADGARRAGHRPSPAEWETQL